MDLFEAIEKRSSVREFDPVEIPQADLEKILDAGRRAPSGMNLQPVSYVVIRSKDTLEKLSVAQACIASASAAILVVADPEISRYWLEDTSAATAYMLLAIKALGYDSVWIEGTLSPHHTFVRETLGLPAGLRPVILLPIGKAAAPVEQRERKPLAQVVHKEKW